MQCYEYSMMANLEVCIKKQLNLSTAMALLSAKLEELHIDNEQLTVRLKRLSNTKSLKLNFVMELTHTVI